jgi:hypothetical protein
MLQVRVQRADHIAARSREPAQERRLAAMVLAEREPAHARILRRQRAHDLPRAIGAPVVDDDELAELR